MKTFLAMLLRMRVMKLSAYQDYWDDDCQIGVVADLTPVKRFNQLRHYIHFCDNTNIKKEDTIGMQKFDQLRIQFATIFFENGA